MKRVITVLTLILLACGGTRAPTQSQPANQEEPVEVPPISEVAVQRAYTVGQDVQVGDVRWKVLDVEDLGNTLSDDNEFTDDVTTAGKFIKISFEVENLQGDPKSYAGVELTDSQNRHYTKSTDAIFFIDNSQNCIFENLNPNLNKACTDIYEVPSDATGLSLVVGDLDLLGSEEALINLGF